MKRSQIRILAILACVALLLGIALAVLRYDPQEKPLDPLVTLPLEQIDQLSFTYRDQSVVLQLQNGLWQVLLSGTDTAHPAKQDVVNAMLQELCSLRPQQLLEDADPELFSASVLQASVDLLSGSGAEQVQAAQQIRVYSMNAITDQLYVQAGDRVYLTDTRLMEILSTPELDLLEQYSIPKPDNHRSVSVQNANGHFLLSCDPALTGAEDGTWCVQLGSLWVPADQDAAYNFYFLTWDMHWKSTAAVITESTDLSGYGLDAPQAVYTLQYGDETFRLSLGTNLPDGTTYAMCDGSSLIYTMDTLLATWLAEATDQSVLPQ